MKRQIGIGVGIVFVITVLLGVIKYFQVSAAIAQHASMKMPPEAVTTYTARLEPWTDSLEAVGSLTAVQGVVLRADAQGVVTKIHHDSGTHIQAGALIIEIDHSVEMGNLKAAEARRDKALRQYNRSQKLLSESATSRAELEANEAEYRAALGDVAALEAQIAKKRITAPFAGKLGIRRVNVGSYVSMGDEIIPLFDDSELHIDFSIAQRLASNLATGLPVELTFENQSKAQGTLVALDPQVDPSTRSVMARALLKNPDGIFRPGSFVHVRVDLPNRDKVIAIPSSAIQYAPYGDSVFVVTEATGADGAQYKGVEQRTVKLGSQRGNLVVVVSGLTEGDEVVTSGTFKLRPGSAIAINNSLAPDSSSHPMPMNS